MTVIRITFIFNFLTFIYLSFLTFLFNLNQILVLLYKETDKFVVKSAIKSPAKPPAKSRILDGAGPGPGGGFLAGAPVEPCPNYQVPNYHIL